MTLRELLAAHPEWADLPVVFYQQDGSYVRVEGTAGMPGGAWIYEGREPREGDDDEPTGDKVLVFDGDC